MNTQKDQKTERLTVQIDPQSLQNLKKRQDELRKTGLPVSLSAVAVQAINKGLKAS